MGKNGEQGRRVFRRRTRKRSKPKRFVKVHQLKCFEEVEERIKLGWQISRVADFVQQERGEYVEVTRDSLMKTLTSFRDTIAATELIQTRMPEKVLEMQEEAEDALDEVKELAALYKLQMERVDMEVGTEKTLKKLFKGTGNEIFIAMKVLQTIAAIKMDYGLKKRDPSSMPQTNVNVLSIDTAKFGSEVVQSVVKDPVSRRKVLSLIEKMSKLEAERKKALMTEGDDADVAEAKIVEATLR